MRYPVEPVSSAGALAARLVAAWAAGMATGSDQDSGLVEAWAWATVAALALDSEQDQVPAEQTETGVAQDSEPGAATETETRSAQAPEIQSARATESAQEPETGSGTGSGSERAPETAQEPGSGTYQGSGMGSFLVAATGSERAAAPVVVPGARTGSAADQVAA